jgi:hypothetical protein
MRNLVIQRKESIVLSPATVISFVVIGSEFGFFSFFSFESVQDDRSEFSLIVIVGYRLILKEAVRFLSDLLFACLDFVRMLGLLFRNLRIGLILFSWSLCNLVDFMIPFKQYFQHVL